MKDICLHTGLECNRFQPHGHAQRMSGHLTQTKFTLVTMTQIEVATHRANTVGDFVLLSKCSYPKLPVAPISHGGQNSVPKFTNCADNNANRALIYPLFLFESAARHDCNRDGFAVCIAKGGRCCWHFQHGAKKKLSVLCIFTYIYIYIYKTGQDKNFFIDFRFFSKILLYIYI